MFCVCVQVAYGYRYAGLKACERKAAGHTPLSTGASCAGVWDHQTGYWDQSYAEMW